MPIFKLEKYPFVCRLCLKPEQPLGMTSLDTEDECFEGGTIEDFLATITLQVEEEKHHLFPGSICPHCMDLLRMFARFRTQVRDVHLFMNALVELRNFNSAPIKELFQTNPDTVRTMLAQLDLCHKADCQAEDLIDEFPHFQIAQLPAVLKDKYLDFEIEMTVKVEPECVVELEKQGADDVITEEELTEVKEELVTESEAKEDIQQNCFDQEEMKVGEIGEATKKRGKYRTKIKEPLQCPKCPYTTIRKTHFNSHQRTHLKRETRSYPCNEPGCTEKYASKVALQKHKEKAKHTTCVCETCGRQCSSNGKLKDHIARVHGVGQLKCEYCEKTFRVKLDLTHHVRNVHLAENIFKCEICGMEYRRKISFQHHQATHSDVYNFPCQKCDKKFKLRTLLLKHIQAVHSEASLECEHCRQMFHVKYKLLDHIENVHGIRMRFFCDVCVANFNSQDSLAAHKARHENPKKLECGQCLTVFPAQEQVLDHVCITYREDYVCCGRDLRYHVQYNKHMLLEHGIRINARVKPDLNALLGKIRVKRKPVLSCSKCKIVLPTRTKKKQHLEMCLGNEIKT